MWQYVKAKRQDPIDKLLSFDKLIINGKAFTQDKRRERRLYQFRNNVVAETLRWARIGCRRKKIRGKINLIIVNCRIAGKVDLFFGLINTVWLPFVLKTEFWLHKSIQDEEVLPPDFSVYCRDRRSYGGNVFLLVSWNLQSTHLDFCWCSSGVCLGTHLC